MSISATGLGIARGSVRYTRLSPTARGASRPVPMRDLATLSKPQLQPGDLLMYRNSGKTLGESAIAQGQRLVSASPLRRNHGDPQIVHVAMWTKPQNAAARRTPFGPGYAEVAEAARGKHNAVIGTALGAGSYKVYRPEDEHLGALAAGNARLWAADRMIPYSKSRAVSSIFRSSTCGAGGRKAADAFAAGVADTAPAWGRKGAYCSQFAVGAYQAAAKTSGRELTGALDVDARYVSPRTLDHLLAKDPGFTPVGEVVVKKSDVAYVE